MKESDEEKGKEDKPEPLAKPDAKSGGEKPDETKGDAKKDAKKDEKKPEKPVEVKFDPEGLSQRILALPMKAGPYADLAAGAANQLFYRRAQLDRSRGRRRALPLRPREAQGGDTLREGRRLRAERRRQARAAAHEGRLVHRRRRRQGRPREVQARRRADPGEDRPARRVGADASTRPGASTATTSTTRPTTAPTGRRCARSTQAFLPDLATRNDLIRVIRWMLSELAVGHSYQSPGDSAFEAETIPGGLLGADYEVASGRYRFKKVFGGLNWTPDLRAPLTEPGVDVTAGEYLLAVDGRELRYPDNLYARFERTAGRFVELTVGPNPDGTGSRTRQGGADRERGGAPQPRLGRGQPAARHGGDAGQGRLRLRPQHRRPGPQLLQALLLPAGRPPGDHRRRAPQRRRAGGRLLHRHPAPAGRELLGDALRRRPQDADRGRSTGPR